MRFNNEFRYTSFCHRDACVAGRTSEITAQVFMNKENAAMGGKISFQLKRYLFNPYETSVNSSSGRLTLLCSYTVPRQDRTKYQDEMSQSRSLGVDKTFVIDNSSTLTSAWMELFVFNFRGDGM
jgi:hypothetical protein